MNEAIYAENISKSYENKIILDKLSLKVAYGEVLCISGVNGSGKSTLIRILAGLIKPDSGKIFINGNQIITNNSSFRKNFGVLLDSKMIYENMSVLENLKFSSVLYNIENPKKEIASVTKILGIYDFLDTRVKNLSKGFKKRTELAKVLLHKPKIILLDEPEINLDKNSIKILKEIILSESKKGSAVILCTHSEGFMSEVGKRFISIDNGELINSKSK
ncbi:MAG: heme ABC exporter ATP-binding protein CcmA [Dehalococcoidia bacterium]|nr:heme ABC exporter ATP-binding protein CcmA [Dehalococcoidia bacterium]